jgi:tetratricopeptide (TPR) repeat protein/DNA-binding response OmpR family regulator
MMRSMGLPGDGGVPRGRSAGDPPGARGGGPRPPESEAEPTVLLVGADKSFHSAIAAALSHHGVYVETAPAHGVVDAVVAAAPDLVLLVGEAAADGGSSVLAHLHTSPHSSVVPVAILADETALDERLRAFRHGAAAVIPRSASVDAIADRIAKLAREIPDRDGGTIGYVGEATLEELVEALSKELRSGILSIKGPKGAEDETIRVVLGGGRPLAQTIDEFVSRIRKHVVHAEPLQYEFDERAGGTVQLLGGDALDAASSGHDVRGLRVLLADVDAARADAVAQALRGHDAEVVVTDYDPPEQRFARLRQFDPAILLIDEPGLRGAGYKLVRRMRRDTRLRWASLLVVRWDEIWSDSDGAAKIARTLGTLSALAEPEHALRERIEHGTSFDTRLEITGPARLVRALAVSPRPVRMTIHNPRVQVRVDLSDHLIAGARAQMLDGSPPIEGARALSTLLVLGSGRVHIERVAEADTVNIMSPVDVALNLADGEAPPLAPSLPAPEPEGADIGFAPTSIVPEAPPRRTNGLVWAGIALASAVVGIGIAVLVATPREPARAPAASAPAAAAPPSAIAAAPKPNLAPEAPPAPAESAAPAAASAPLPAAPAPAPDVDGETPAKAPSCEEIVGPSWSLLSSDEPRRALTEIRLGRRALMLGRLGEAQQSFCRAAVLDPTNPEAFLALVRVLLLQRDTTQAREWAERAAKQHPDNPDVQGLYGDALARAGDADRARGIWLAIGKVDVSDTASIRGMAYNYVRGGDRSVQGADYAQADRLYRRAILLDPLNATAAAGLARVLLVMNETQAALHWAKRAVALEPRAADLHVMLGDVLEKTGDAQSARSEWKAAYDIDPHNFKAASRMLRASK